MDGSPAHLGQKIDPSVARVAVDGIPLPLAPDLVYYLVYKPTGIVSTADDPHGRDTVVQLLPSHPRVYPVGRLDADSEGLLVVTNDGDLTLRLTHPRFGVEKTYAVLVGGNVSSATVRRLLAGVDLDDGPAAAIRSRVLDRMPDASLLEITMGEGRKREVRRMMDAVGHPVVRLVRVAIGPLRDPGLKSGRWRTLSTTEVRALYAAAAAGASDG